MARWLKTGIDNYVTVGPFLDKTTGIDLEDGFTTSNISYLWVKETLDSSDAHVTGTCDTTAANDWGMAAVGHGGMYTLKIPDAVLDYVGSGMLTLWDADECLPVWHEFLVLPATTFDALITNAAGAAGGIMICGSNAATTFATLTSTGALTAGSMAVTGALTVGDGIAVTCSTGSKSGIKVTGGATAGIGVEIIGTGTGDGLKCTGGTGGATGNGISAISVATNGRGMNLLGNGTGSGLYSTGTGAPGIYGVGAGAFAGIAALGGTNTAGILATGGATNAPGISAIGTGSGDGLYCKGGLTGDGIQGLGGATSGHGMHLSQVGNTGSGLEIESSNNGDAIKATGKGTGHGMFLQSGDGASGDGLRAVSLASNGNGIYGQGFGSGDGISGKGGATGDGIQGTGGTNGAGIHANGLGTGNGLDIDSVSGDGINVTVQTSGHGLSLTAVGSSKHGITATGGNAGTSDGIKAAAGTGGVDIRGNITGNLSGTVTTVTTVTNQLTAAQIATGVWQDATAGDFTAASSIGKDLYVGGVVPGASGGHMISGSNAGTTTLAALTVTGALSTGAVTKASETITGALTTGSVVNNGTTTLTGAVGTGALTVASQTVTGALTTGSIVNNGTTTLTGAVGTGALTVASQTVTGALTTGSIVNNGVTTLTGAVGTGAVTKASESITGAFSVGTTTTLTGAVSTGAVTKASETITGALTVSNGIDVSCTTGGRAAVALTGNGAGPGLYVAGGDTASGLKCTSGAGSTDKAGIEAIGIGTTARGVQATGVLAGVNAAASAGNGMTLTSSGSNGTGLSATGNGSGAGISATGGATGAGLLATGGGNNADADGIRAVAGGALAADVDADITGNLTGSVSGSVGSVTTKTGYELAATGADLVLKTSTFALAMADAVWDEVLTGATHNVASSAGRRVRNLGAFSLVEGTVGAVAAIGTQTVTLDAAAAATARLYEQNLICIYEGSGAGQSRMIIEYTAAKVATVDRPWDVALDGTSLYSILGFSGIIIANNGVAQAGGASTITLATNALNIANSYVGGIVYIAAGTGAGQARVITAYDVGRIATVSPAWDTQPDITSAYKVIPLGRSIVDSLADDVITAAKFDESTAFPLKLANSAKLAASVSTLVAGTVATAGFAATTTEFEASDITEATADHYKGRLITFTSGALVNQQTDITAYSLVGGRGHFTMTACTEAPANLDTFVIQ